jgi:protein-tyrosine-phosphatase
MSREVASGSTAQTAAALAGAAVTPAARELPRAVLFACTTNAVRSVMAAAILRHLAGKRAYVASAGVRAGAADPFVTAVMDEIGIDVSQHTPNTLHDLHDTSFDLIVTLSPEAHHQALELTRTMAVDVEYWPTIDATVMLGYGTREQTLMHYREVRDQLFERIKKRFGFEGGPTV